MMKFVRLDRVGTKMSIDLFKWVFSSVVFCASRVHCPRVYLVRGTFSTLLLIAVSAAVLLMVQSC